MSSIYLLKPKFQALLKPVVEQLYKAGCTANQITVVTLIASLSMALALYFIPSTLLWLCVPLFMLLRMALNAIDGMLARLYNMQSNLGYVLNEIADLLADAAFLLAFATLSAFYSPWLISMLLLIWLSEVCALLVVSMGHDRPNSGPMGKSDRAVLFAIFAILIGLEVDQHLLSDWFFGIGQLLLIVTCFNRLRIGLTLKKE